MQRVFKSYSDPSHGWAAVPRPLLAELGILARISHCSYQRGDTVYLEEDDDLSLFVATYEQATGERPRFSHRTCANRRSRIRGYESFYVTTTEEQAAMREETALEGAVLELLSRDAVFDRFVASCLGETV